MLGCDLRTHHNTVKRRHLESAHLVLIYWISKKNFLSFLNPIFIDMEKHINIYTIWNCKMHLGLEKTEVSCKGLQMLMELEREKLYWLHAKWLMCKNCPRWVWPWEYRLGFIIILHRIRNSEDPMSSEMQQQECFVQQDNYFSCL